MPIEHSEKEALAEQLSLEDMKSTNFIEDVSLSGEYGLSPKDKRRIMMKLDIRLVGTVGLMYTMAMLDRTNLSAAIIAGMQEDLNLIGNRYSIITLVFFVSYVVLQPVAIVVCRKLGPRIFMSSILFIWGGVVIAMGFAKQWGVEIVLRLLLGALEAGFFPSGVYLLSTWYTRFEVGKRYSVFYTLGIPASGFGGILAYGLMQMKGLANLNGWSWIFIIEGILASFIGAIGYWTLVEFPDRAKGAWTFLSDQEIDYITAKVDNDRGDTNPPPFSLKKFLHGGTDICTWAYAMMAFDNSCVVYALAYFMPIILKENMGFDLARSQTLVAPPYVFAAIVMFASGWLGDRLRMRGPIIIGLMVMSIIGVALMGFAKQAGVRYFGVFLTNAGANSAVPVVMSLQANNIRGQWKRAFCSASFVGFNGIGGIAGGLVFRDQDKPGYRPGLYTCFVCSGLNILISIALMFRFSRLNKKAETGVIELEMEDDECPPGFRYTL